MRQKVVADETGEKSRGQIMKTLPYIRNLYLVL